MRRRDVILRKGVFEAEHLSRKPRHRIIEMSDTVAVLSQRSLDVMGKSLVSNSRHAVREEEDGSIAVKLLHLEGTERCKRASERMTCHDGLVVWIVGPK